MILGFFGGVSCSGSAIHFQLRWPFLSNVQAPPPRCQISHRQWSLLAGIANKYVNAAVIITPNNVPVRNMRLIFLFPTIPLYQGSKPSLRPVPSLGDIDKSGSLCMGVIRYLWLNS